MQRYNFFRFSLQMSKKFHYFASKSENVSRPSASNPVSAQAIYYPFVVAPCKVRFEYQARGKFCYYDLRN